MPYSISTKLSFFALTLYLMTFVISGRIYASVDTPIPALEKALAENNVSKYPVTFDLKKIREAIAEFRASVKDESSLNLETTGLPTLVTQRLRLTSKILTGSESFFQLEICGGCQAEYSDTRPRVIRVEPRFFVSLIEYFGTAATPAIDYVLLHEMGHHIYDREFELLESATKTELPLNFMNHCWSRVDRPQDLPGFANLSANDQAALLEKYAVEVALPHVTVDMISLIGLADLHEQPIVAEKVLAYVYDSYRARGKPSGLSNEDLYLSVVGLLLRYNAVESMKNLASEM